MGLPTLEHDHPLRLETIQSFQKDGHVVVRGLATAAEIDPFRQAVLEVGEKGRVDKRPFEKRDTYGRAFIQMFNLWQHSDVVRRFVFARRFAKVAAELMSVSGVRLYHDQALFKEPGGGFTPWHQDQFYWPLATEHTITLWIPLVAVTPKMGTMRFASGSHRFGHLGDFPIGDESQREFDRLVEERNLTLHEDGAFALGDASFHSGWTLHSAPGNETNQMREVMTVIYFADGTKVGPLDHPNRQFDRDVWLPGCEPGELAASAMNPVLWTDSP